MAQSGTNVPEELRAAARVHKRSAAAHRTECQRLMRLADLIERAHSDPTDTAPMEAQSNAREDRRTNP